MVADGAAGNAQQTAAECAAACGSSSKCNAWQWCADNGGCPTEFGGSELLPPQACRLQTQKLAPGNPMFEWRPSRFVAGYNGGARRNAIASSSDFHKMTLRNPAEHRPLLCAVNEPMIGLY